MNSINLLGRITGDPELKKTPSDVSVTSFTVAVERNFADKNTGKKPVDFINVVAWRGTADLICKYVKKGSLIGITGSLQARKYEDKDGNKRTAYEVVAENIYFTGKGNSNNEKSETKEASTKQKSGFEEEFEEFEADDSDLPY